MRAQKVFLASLLVLLAVNTAFLSTVRVGAVVKTLSVTGRLKLDKLGLQGANSRITVRLYPPKAENRPVLIAYGDGNGYFTFTGITEGSYLIEAYSDYQMVYQKAIQIRAGSGPILDDRFLYLDERSSSDEGEIIQRDVKLKQRNKMALDGFQGKVSVSIGNINRLTNKVTITILETGGGKIIAKEDKKIGNNIYVEFTYDGIVYVLKGSTNTPGLITSYLYFHIFRKTS